MSYAWFKLHHELPDDIKLRKFAPQEKWAWVVLLCLASKSSKRGIIYAHDDDIAEYCEFNITQDWLYYRDKLIAKGMLEFTQDGGLKVEHWEDRQYEKPSDRPEAVKARVTKHRVKKKAEKESAVTPCNALQTPCNADETPQIRLDKIRRDTDPDPEENLSKNTHTLNARASVETNSGETCDRGFQKFPWGFFQDPDPAFLSYLAKEYLPTIPSNEGKAIGVHAAKQWLVKAKYDNQRLDIALIQHEAFVTWRDGVESSAAPSAVLSADWMQQITALINAGKDSRDFYKLPDGRFDQEKLAFYNQHEQEIQELDNEWYENWLRSEAGKRFVSQRITG